MKVLALILSLCLSAAVAQQQQQQQSSTAEKDPHASWCHEWVSRAVVEVNPKAKVNNLKLPKEAHKSPHACRLACAEAEECSFFAFSHKEEQSCALLTNAKGSKLSFGGEGIVGPKECTLMSHQPPALPLIDSWDFEFTNPFKGKISARLEYLGPEHEQNGPKQDDEPDGSRIAVRNKCGSTTVSFAVRVTIQDNDTQYHLGFFRVRPGETRVVDVVEGDGKRVVVWFDIAGDRKIGDGNNVSNGIGDTAILLERGGSDTDKICVAQPFRPYNIARGAFPRDCPGRRFWGLGIPPSEGTWFNGFDTDGTIDQCTLLTERRCTLLAGDPGFVDGAEFGLGRNNRARITLGRDGTVSDPDTFDEDC
ncbi:unnamed protein product [Vitrella brassicaformis CCMP3155]|uniref:Apple domain-containing protein n=1 Tax=Vitrella brassicaformis (strain CCMP3155) TaxID=1169540 RepID=A0A0G4GSS2_VITBC|nr:unnamed protein product [Vitrella brassicaformis CCMP3155]|eukprot:CEM33744.1 unnamed protein product [Vitrella brassicaformis CCMP3155]